MRFSHYVLSLGRQAHEISLRKLRIQLLETTAAKILFLTGEKEQIC